MNKRCLFRLIFFKAFFLQKANSNSLETGCNSICQRNILYIEKVIIRLEQRCIFRNINHFPQHIMSLCHYSENRKLGFVSGSFPLTKNIFFYYYLIYMLYGSFFIYFLFRFNSFWGLEFFCKRFTGSHMSCIRQWTNINVFLKCQSRPAEILIQISTGFKF